MYIHIYPNPFQEEVKFLGFSEKQANIRIYNSFRQFEYKRLIENAQSRKINLSFLIKGVYVLWINQKGKISNMKIVKD